MLQYFKKTIFYERDINKYIKHVYSLENVNGHFESKYL